jgi:hypothetical protein
MAWADHSGGNSVALFRILVDSRVFIDARAMVIAARALPFRPVAIGPASPLGGRKRKEGLMDACFVRSTMTWLAAIFVSSLFVTAATSTVSIL